VGVHSTEQSAGIIVGAFDPNIMILYATIPAWLRIILILF